MVYLVLSRIGKTSNPAAAASAMMLLISLFMIDKTNNPKINKTPGMIRRYFIFEC